MKVTITRHPSADVGTFGMLVAERGPLTFSCYTGELPWRDNKSNVSCIPAGVYQATRHDSRKFGKVYLVNSVPKRAGILIHAANYFGNRDLGLRTDVEGCIGLGMGIAILDGQQALTHSRHAISAFEFFLSFGNFELEIINK